MKHSKFVGSAQLIILVLEIESRKLNYICNDYYNKQVSVK